MRSAARHQAADEPEPDLAAVTAKAGQLLDAMRATSGRITATLAAWDTVCPQDSRAVPVLQGLATELVGAGLHAEELRQETERLIAGLGSLDAAFAAGREHERKQAQQAPPAVPGPRHASGRRLRVVPGGVAVLVGAACAALHRALIAHRVAAAASAGVALAATTAVLVPSSSLPFTSSAPPPVPAVAGPVGAAPWPWPSSSLAARKGRSRALVAGLPSLPAYAPPVAGLPTVPGPGPSSPLVAGVLSVSTSALDLGTLGLGSITLSCNGGPCDWHVLPGRHVSADTREGVLSPGESVTVGLNIDPAALVLGGSSVVRVWPGDTAVAVSWSAPVVQVPVDPASDLPSLPPLLGS